MRVVALTQDPGQRFATTGRDVPRHGRRQLSGGPASRALPRGNVRDDPTRVGHLPSVAQRAVPRPAAATWHRIPRRGLALAAALIVVSVGAATAAGLISVGTPASDKQQRDLPATLRPDSGSRTIAVTAADPARKLPWAVATYTARDGRDCALLGQAQLGVIGELEGGTFHPYAADRPGICGQLDRVPLVFAPGHSADQPQRTLVFGRARPGVTAVTIKDPQTTHTVRTGPGGAFLAVLDGRLPNGSVTVSPAGDR